MTSMAQSQLPSLVLQLLIFSICFGLNLSDMKSDG